MQIKNFYIEIELSQESKANQNVCGDACESRKIKEEDRIITVLSDGLGSGIKANILATMTTSMALQFTAKNNPVERTAEFIMNTLPIDSQRKISYSTFTIVNIDCFGEAHIVEFDNPPVLIFRNGSFLNLNKKKEFIARPDNIKAMVSYYNIKLQKEDRIILVSDGITQSGMGKIKTPFGWSNDGLQNFIQQAINNKPDISAQQLSHLITERAKANDSGLFKDDATCQVIYCRTPRKLVLASGPPYYDNYDRHLAERVESFDGKKIICGGTTSKIISRELNRPIEVIINTEPSDLPPISKMDGIDFITEGILTLGKVSGLLEKQKPATITGNGPAEKIIRFLLSCDSILILAGTQVNNAHQDPNLPVELEIRRNVLKKIRALLEEKYFKTVEIEYL
ncbi:MAG: SpoIIE family protein phosphatase [Marinilabiliaceae bacterium]|nr:SpoIIE family protein phosphatase [Marinilabiliaceae bacterium]